MSADNYNGDLHAWIEPDIEARVVALILGEASDFETEELERLMEERPEIRIFKRRLESVHDLLGEVCSSKDDKQWRLAAPRRDKLMKDLLLVSPPGEAPVVTGDGGRAHERRIRKAGRRVAWAVAACLALTLFLVVLVGRTRFGIEGDAVPYSWAKGEKSSGLNDARYVADRELKNQMALMPAEELAEEELSDPFGAPDSTLSTDGSGNLTAKVLFDQTPIPQTASVRTEGESDGPVTGFGENGKELGGEGSDPAGPEPVVTASPDPKSASEPASPLTPSADFFPAPATSASDSGEKIPPTSTPGLKTNLLEAEVPEQKKTNLNPDSQAEPPGSLDVSGVVRGRGVDATESPSLVGGRPARGAVSVDKKGEALYFSFRDDLGEGWGGSGEGGGFGTEGGKRAPGRKDGSVLRRVPGGDSGGAKIESRSLSLPEGRGGRDMGGGRLSGAAQGQGQAFNRRKNLEDSGSLDLQPEPFSGFAETPATKTPAGSQRQPGYSGVKLREQTEIPAEKGALATAVPDTKSALPGRSSRVSRETAEQGGEKEKMVDEERIAVPGTLANEIFPGPDEDSIVPADRLFKRNRLEKVRDRKLGELVRPTNSALRLGDEADSDEAFSLVDPFSDGGRGEGRELLQGNSRSRSAVNEGKASRETESLGRWYNAEGAVPEDLLTGQKGLAKSTEKGKWESQLGGAVVGGGLGISPEFELGVIPLPQKAIPSLSKDLDLREQQKQLFKEEQGQLSNPAVGAASGGSTARAAHDGGQFASQSSPEAEPTELRTWDIPQEAWHKIQNGEAGEERQLTAHDLVAGRKADTSLSAARDALINYGVDFPPGSSVLYTAATGTFSVKNTPANLGLVDVIIQNSLRQLSAEQEALRGFEKHVGSEPKSTFSLNVSDVSFKLAKASLAGNQWPSANQIRTEEFVNAFDYGDPAPSQDERVACRVEQAAHPFLQQRNLMRVSMRTAAQGRAAGIPLRLTVLLDNSGSMDRADRVASVKEAFRLLASQLTKADQVTLVSFARTARLLADRMPGDQVGKLVELVENTPSEGGTNLEQALGLGMAKAKEQKVEGGQNRVILLTDGAANLGNAKPDELARLVEAMRQQGIAFDACGVGANGYNDEILESLTRKGDGRYYFLDRAEDADEGFARQIAGALRPAARNVKVQVNFNPNRVGRYKLYGFEKHRLKKEDFRNDSVDAAELAAEEAGNAIYQIEVLPEGTGDLGTVSVRFQDAVTGRMVEKKWTIPYQPQPPFLEKASSSLRLAASAALVGEKLKDTLIGEVVEMPRLSSLVNSLPADYPADHRVKDLVEMTARIRELTGE